MPTGRSLCHSYSNSGFPRRTRCVSVRPYPTAFALAVDLALLSLGGGLKRQEMVSARFGDILSELYLSSAALKRWNDEGRPSEDFQLLAYCMEASFATLDTRIN